MKTTNFAVSVQHGNGPHYFLRSDLDTEEAAIKVYLKHKYLLETKPPRGPKPTVFMWCRYTPKEG